VSPLQDRSCLAFEPKREICAPRFMPFPASDDSRQLVTLFPLIARNGFYWCWDGQDLRCPDPVSGALPPFPSIFTATRAPLFADPCPLARPSFGVNVLRSPQTLAPQAKRAIAVTILTLGPHRPLATPRYQQTCPGSPEFMPLFHFTSRSSVATFHDWAPVLSTFHLFIWCHAQPWQHPRLLANSLLFLPRLLVLAGPLHRFH